MMIALVGRMWGFGRLINGFFKHDEIGAVLDTVAIKNYDCFALRETFNFALIGNRCHVGFG